MYFQCLLRHIISADVVGSEVSALLVVAEGLSIVAEGVLED